MEAGKCKCCSENKEKPAEGTAGKEEVLVTHLLVEKKRGQEVVIQLDDGEKESEKPVAEGNKNTESEKPVAEGNKNTESEKVKPEGTIIEESQKTKQEEAPKEETGTEAKSKENQEVNAASGQSDKPGEGKDNAKEQSKTTATSASSPLATYFKDWDKFTNGQKEEIERYIKRKAEEVRTAGVVRPFSLTPAEREERWRKERERRDRRIRSYKERMYQFRNGGARHGAPLDLAVKKASSGPAHNVALSLNRNQRRSPQDRGRRNTRPHMGNGDQRYGPKYRSRRSYYVRRRQPRRELRSSARLRLNPWAPLNEGPHVLGELMRQVHDFMRLFSSIPAVYQKPPTLTTPPIGYQTATRTAQYSLKNEDSSRRYPEKLIISPAQRTAQYSLKNEDSSRRYPEKLIISPAQRSVGTATSQQYSVKTEDTSRRPQAKALPPQPTQRTPGVRMTPYLLPTTRTDVRWRIYPGVGNTARYEENRFNNGPSYPTYKR